MSRRPPGAVVVGAGLMGRWHVHALAAAGVRLAAVVDERLERAEALSRKHGRVPVAGDLAELPRDVEADAVHVCTPLATHERLVGLSLEAGRHVLVEKPFAASAEATGRLLDDARARGLVVCPVHQLLFQDGFRRVLDAVGRLGPVRHVDAVICSAGAGGRDQADAVAFEILPHPLSLLVRLLPGFLAGAEWHAAHPAGGELRIVGAGAGVSCAILVSMAGRPTRNTLRVVGERGTAHVDFFHGFEVLEGGGVSRARKVARPFALSAATFGAATVNLVRRTLRRRPAYPGLCELVGSFHAALRTREDPPIPPAETLEVAVALDALRGLVAGQRAP